MLLAIPLLELGKEDFIAALGGPTAPIGPHGCTAEEFACTLDELLTHLTRPGSRVIRSAYNRQLFWHGVIDVVGN